MAKYKDKWKTTFPTSIGNQTRPEDSVDNTQEYNTDGLPQYMANDPVRYDLQNAVNSQLVSNDERLNEKIKRTSDDLAAHNKDPKAHATGIAGNAATASKLLTPRTISLTGKAAGSTSFDGSSNASINVTSVNADTASKLSTARKINITGNATGAANFDGTGDISINTTVNESKHAATSTKATSATTAASFVNGKAGGSWVSGMTQSNSLFQWTTAGVRDGSRYDPIMWGKDVEGNVWNLAWSAEGGIGFTGYKAGRTANGMDGSIYFDPKTGITRGSFQGELNGTATNATSATTAGNVSGKIYYSADSPSVATDKLFVVKRATSGDDNVPNNGLVIQSGPTGSSYNGKLYITDNGNDGVWVGGVAEGKEVGWKRLVENWGSWNINAATATNSAAADKVNNSGNKTAIGDGTREPNGLYLYQCYNNGYPTSYGNVISIGGAGGSELLAGWSGADKGIEHLYYRSRRGSGALWSDWRTVAFTSDINSYAPTLTGGGASGTWPISISGNAAGLSGNLVFPGIGDVATSNGISWNGSTDGADIYYQTTASDQGNLVLNLRDDANCYLRIACNGAFKSYFSPSNGNFHGNVNGNADTATNADKLDGYHASDIINKITAANTGGIVAAALDTNGYVKFANGLTVQWGYLGTTHNGNMKVTFPIAFKTIFNLVCDMIGLCTGSSDNGSLNIQSYNTTGASFFNTDDHDGTGLFWRAVGIV